MINWIDIIIVFFLVLSAVISFSRGFIREALSLLIWISAFWIAFHFMPAFSALMSPKIGSPTARNVIAFILLLIATLIVGGLVKRLIVQLVRFTGLGGTDRLLGVIFGLARGALLIAMVVLLADFTSFPQESWWKESKLIPQFHPLEQWLKDLLPAAPASHHKV